MSSIYDFSLSLYENGQWNDCRDLLEEQLNLAQEIEDRDDLVLLLALLYMQRNQKEELHRLLVRYEVLSARKEIVPLIMGEPLRNFRRLDYSQDSIYCYSLGVYWSLCGKALEAQKAYERALELNPSFIPIYNNLALIYEETGNVAEAKNTYEKGLALNKDDPYLQINLAIFLSRIGSFRKNWTISSSLTQLPPSLLAMLVSFLFVCEERYELAIKVLDRQLCKTENITSLWYARGLILEAQGFFEQAFSSYQKAWRLDLSNKTVVRALLQLLLNNNRLNEMLEIICLLREEDPHREDVRFFQAILQIKRKDWQGAELNLRYILNHAQVKNLYTLAKDIPNIHSIDPIINVDLSESFYEHSWYLLAMLYDHTGKYEQSLLVLEQLQKDIPNNDLYLFSYVLLLSKIGKTHLALKKLENTLEKSPNQVMGHLLKAKIFFEEGSNERALEILHTLNAEDPQVKLLKKEIEQGVRFNSQEEVSQLWQLPWPKLENSLKKYFTDSSQRSYRFLWQIKDSTFFIPALPAETISNQEMLSFYQEIPLNASSPLEDLYEPLEAGESVLVEELEREKLRADSSVNCPKPTQDQTQTDSIIHNAASTVASKNSSTVEDLALFLEAIEDSPLLDQTTSQRICIAKKALLGPTSLSTLNDWLDFWQKSFTDIQSK